VRRVSDWAQQGRGGAACRVPFELSGRGQNTWTTCLAQIGQTARNTEKTSNSQQTTALAADGDGQPLLCVSPRPWLHLFSGHLRVTPNQVTGCQRQLFREGPRSCACAALLSHSQPCPSTPATPLPSRALAVSTADDEGQTPANVQTCKHGAGPCLARKQLSM
jgi:hypothetical protein